MSVYRKVVSTEEFESGCNLTRGTRIWDTLECGHVASVKGSRGFASRRKCRTCTDLKRGCEIEENGIRYSWDPETEMPKGVPVE